jgi:uncharacterized protein YndB with AHSA1/START domain
MRIMAANDLHLVTEWALTAPPEAIWAVLTHPEDWPSWWRAVEKVELIEPGDPEGLNVYRRFTWRTALPYRVRFAMRVTRVEPMSVIEGWADGELSGVGRWTLTHYGHGTRVRYDWHVKLNNPWMRLLAPVLRSVFAWNHNKVMAWGYEGLARKLAAENVASSVREEPRSAERSSGVQSAMGVKS